MNTQPPRDCTPARVNDPPTHRPWLCLLLGLIPRSRRTQEGR